ncbi:MAG: flavin-containing monooxygenase [Bacillota bacterium]
MERKHQAKKIRKAKIIVIGTGFSGIAAAARLLQAGERDLIVLERGSDVGGVWRDNRYPGCACDVESHLYSLSFAPNPGWSRKFSPQSEIYAYLQDCAKKFGLIDHIRFQHEVERLDWDEPNREWRIQTNQGEVRAAIVVGAVGALSNPSIPELEGIERFQGEVFHSAQWPADFNPNGKRIAVVGTGASAIQFIPHIQPDARFLHVFQRTPAWVIPQQDAPIKEGRRKKYRRFPALRKMTRLKLYTKREAMVVGFRHPNWLRLLERMAVKHMHEAIQDPALREKLRPDYRIGCKRILLSNTYYPALAQANTQVHTTGVAEVTENAVIDAAGSEIQVDSIIFGTGFQVTDYPIAQHIFGRLGHSLQEEWNGSPKAYLGTTISGFPNLFLIQGPNTGLGHTSVILMIEAQVEHLLKVLEYMKQNKLETIEPRAGAQERFVEETERLMKGTVWTSGGCRSWYLDKTGRNSTLWPRSTLSFRKKAAAFRAEDYLGTSGLGSGL